jgi:hypothetical protein
MRAVHVLFGRFFFSLLKDNLNVKSSDVFDDEGMLCFVPFEPMRFHPLSGILCARRAGRQAMPAGGFFLEPRAGVRPAEVIK